MDDLKLYCFGGSNHEEFHKYNGNILETSEKQMLMDTDEVFNVTGVHVDKGKVQHSYKSQKYKEQRINLHGFDFKVYVAVGFECKFQRLTTGELEDIFAMSLICSSKDSVYIHRLPKLIAKLWAKSNGLCFIEKGLEK